MNSPLTRTNYKIANSAPKTVVSIPLLVTQNKDLYMMEFRIVAEYGERRTLRGGGMIDNLTMVGTRDTHCYKIIRLAKQDESFSFLRTPC